MCFVLNGLTDFSKQFSFSEIFVLIFGINLIACSQHTLRTQVRAEIESILEDLMEPMEPIKDLMAPFFEINDLVFNSIKAIKDAYQTLKDS